MKQSLAEELLAKVLGWEPGDIAKERPLLQAMASFKYDEYEQYSPGMRFLESLALWLNQIEPADRGIAYRFVKTRLVFCSSDEMDHLVETAYPDHIRPLLMKLAAAEASLNRWHVRRIAASTSFRLLQRSTLFLGLSDGARIDTFRRANPDLNHEQIWQTHELSKPRVEELLDKLSKHVDAIQGASTGCSKTFRSIVLLDDFSASGSSYYTRKLDGTAGGKIAKFLNSLGDETNAIHSLCDPRGVELIILIYAATEQALSHLRSSFAQLPVGIKAIHINTIQSLSQTLTVSRQDVGDMTPLIEKYYDHDIFDVHMQKGATPDGKYGYADCGLPVVLHHNTPNNSIALLWSYENTTQRGLFPRVQRHREMS